MSRKTASEGTCLTESSPSSHATLLCVALSSWGVGRLVTKAGYARPSAPVWPTYLTQHRRASAAGEVMRRRIMRRSLSCSSAGVVSAREVAREGELDLLDLASGTEGDRDLRCSPADGSCAGALAEETFLLGGAGREDVPSEKEQVLRARGLGWPDTKSGARVDGVRWRDDRLSA